MIVDYYLAKILEQTGYPQGKTISVYRGNILSDRLVNRTGVVDAPDYSDVIDWLDEKKIYINIVVGEKGWESSVTFNQKDNICMNNGSNYFNTRIEAIKKAILCSLSFLSM